MSAKTRSLYNTVAMQMFVVFNIPPFCSLDSFASHLFRVFVHLNTIKKQGLSRDLRPPSAIFCLVFYLFSKTNLKHFHSFCVKHMIKIKSYFLWQLKNQIFELHLPHDLFDDHCVFIHLQFPLSSRLQLL